MVAAQDPQALREPFGGFAMVGNHQYFVVGKARLAVVAEFFQQPVDAWVDMPPGLGVQRIVA